ncbi:hypothetical protein INT44_003433 [Umbelopsis vinacea]|uniref:Amino acid transporter transmembrane domain-containing protein n=1 Tax=Umbelopsis vinacea TaxID=44442 RepID=A0A8H7UIM0_9FUNG|nr:hypothetical protein INT44_003433 [Umbelopsis vinacea]
MAEAANLPPAIPPFGTSPAPSFGRSFPNHPVDIAEHLFSAHGAPVPSNSVAAYESGLINLPEDQVARVVKEHLLLGSPKLSGRASPSLHSVYDSDAASNAGHSSIYDDHDTSDYQATVHQLPGGSIVDGIYKWAANVDSQDRRPQRSKSFSLPPGRDIDDSTASDLRAPGGFRRHYVINKAVEQGKAPPNYITKNFFDFLCLYGNFGGEDLNDDEGYEEAEEDEEIAAGDENTPLIPKQDQPPQGTATASKAVFLLLKSFVGTGVMFLPKAFYNGGLVFSIAVLIGIASISLYAFLLLVKTRSHVTASFGDMGGILFGPSMRFSVLVAITLSQIGFVCAYMVFVAQNLQSLVLTFSNCRSNVALPWLILVQCFVFIPLAMIRRIQKLSVFALIADVFILFGLAYLYYFDFLTLATTGLGKIAMFNSKNFTSFIGTAVFTYEGVGLVIPITESMKEPHKFPRVLTGTMIFITILFTSVGAISYMAFGDQVQTVILLNLPTGDPMVSAVQTLYSIAICLSIPLQLFPAIRIIETGLFTRSGKYNNLVKWQKNVFRFFFVLLCAAIAIGGSNDLDKFVSIVGSFCCVPLCFIFPPLFHLKAVARTTWERSTDIAIIVFGVCSMVFTTGITIAEWGSTAQGPNPIDSCVAHGN